MTSRVRWAVAVAVAVVVVAVVSTPAAAGGGPALVQDRESYRPGDRVDLQQEEVYKASRDWRGPYGVWMFRTEERYQPYNAAVVSAPVPRRHVGDLRVERWSDEYVRVSLSFTMPEVPYGAYELEVCNPGCTNESLFLRGNLFVGDEPRGGTRFAPSPPARPARPDPEDTPPSVAPPTATVPTAAPAVLTGGRPEATQPGLTTVEWLAVAGFALGIVGWAFFGNGELLRRRHHRRARREIHEAPIAPPSGPQPDDPVVEIELTR
jgi:hypothetical protein